MYESNYFTFWVGKIHGSVAVFCRLFRRLLEFFDLLSDASRLLVDWLIHSNTESANLFKRSRAYDLPSQRSLKNFWLNWTSKGSHLSTGKPGDYFILVIAFCRKLSKILVSFPRLHEPFVFSVFNVMSLLATLLTHTFLISVWSLKIP